MRSWTGQRADAATSRAWDGIVVFWVVLWLVVGCLSGIQIFQLSDLADSTVSSGRALGTAGEALSSLSEVPVIGDRTGELGEQVSQTAGQIRSSGEQAGRTVRVLGILVGVAIALGPVGPVLLLYLPARTSRRREADDVLSALRAGGRAEVTAQLAHRAVTNLTLRELAGISADPVGDLAAGRHRRLADAELRRLGIEPLEAP